MPSNLTLLLFGLFIGTFSALYPRLPAYLPPSLSARLPFLPHQSLSPESQAWAGYQRYQHKIPIAANHDPWDVEEPRLERERRLMSKDGDKERAKMEERERRALEDRTETAGEENLIGEALPVYFVDADKDSTWARLTQELISEIKPKTVILLSPLSTSFNAITVTSSPVSRPILVALAHQGILAHTDAMPTDATGSTRVAALRKKLETRKIDLVEIGLPPNWPAEHLTRIGRGLNKLRNDNAVLLGMGSWASMAVPKEALHHALVAHTSHPRDVAVEKIRGIPAALVAIASAGGEGEGESLDGGQGLSWRFGHMPLVKKK